MESDQFIVNSRLGRKNFLFHDESAAFEFYDNFLGDARISKNWKEIRRKNTITDPDSLIQAGILIQHGIISINDSHTIKTAFLKSPEQVVIDKYKEAVNIFSKSGKGIGIFGDDGVGKTTLIRFLQMASEAGYIGGKEFESVIVHKIISTFKKHGSEVLELHRLDTESGLNICIDDLGSDNGLRMIYGDKVNIVSDIIKSRYDSYIDNGLITHFTTNYGKEELQAIYDSRGLTEIWGRILEMTDFLFIEGTNYRLDPL